MEYLNLIWKKNRACLPLCVFVARMAIMVVVISIGLSGAAQAQGLVRNCTPIVWQTDGFVDWAGDVSPQNGIDDLIDASPDPTFDIVVNFNDCVEDADVSFLNGLATVQRRSKYISSVSMTDATKADISSIVADSRVAFVEIQPIITAFLDVSVPNIQVSASLTYSPNTVEDLDPTIDGSGINIAILDTGVDNTVHDAFNATTLVAGYNAFTQTFVDPDDDQSHGTHVASIAMGQATAGTSRGVAPAANLIDVKICDSFGSCPWNMITDGLETVYDNRTNWGVDVINMSVGGGSNQDGTESLNQLIDLAESMGIVVVVAAGNSGPANASLGTPAAATRAITVAASNDLNTVTRVDDTIAVFSSKGPRSGDNDADCLDELKPEVTAPGQGIVAALFNSAVGAVSKSGTSMASPHVAGLAALIIEANPGINAASVKDLLISTAEQRGTASQPACDSDWNERWGWGLVNGFDAVNQVTQTNMRFPSHPPDPIWLSPDIMLPFGQPKKNQPNVVRVRVRNAGANPANNVRVHLGAADLTTNLPNDPFHDIGTQIVSLSGSTNQDIDFTWTPTADGHMCLKAEIGYGPDTDYSDNNAQRNVTVAASPITFRAKNSLTEAPSLIVFEPTFAYAGACWGTAEPCNDDSECPPRESCMPQDWTVDINPPSVTLAADDCPEVIEVDLQPGSHVMPGSRQTVHVAAKIGGTLIGGISVESNPNQTPEPVAQIPALSQWGLFTLVLLLLTVAMVLLLRRSFASAGAARK